MKYKEVFAALDQVVTNLLLPLIQSKKFIEKVLTEREQLSSEVEYTK